MAAADGSNGWSNAQRYLAVILATAALLGLISGAVYGWADFSHCLADHSKRITAVEARQEAAQADALRVERKVDRLLIEQGINPDDIR